MYKEPNLNKELHLHLYEYRKLGGSITEEGKEYETKYMNELLKEMKDCRDTFVYRRNKIGVNDKIHNQSI